MKIDNDQKQYKLRTRWKGLVPVLCLAAMLHHSCMNEECEPVGVHNEKLVIEAKVGQQESRSILTGNTLPDDSEIGVTVVDAKGSTYQNVDYDNIRFTAVKKDGKQVFDGDMDIMLSGEPATLYAYYPFQKNTDIENIAVDLDEQQIDWLYAIKKEGLSNINAKADIMMNHALANMKISLVKGEYNGKGNVSNVSLQSTGLTSSASLNAKTGELTYQPSSGETLSCTLDETLSDEPIEINVLFVPTSETEVPIKVTLTIDEKEYSVESPKVTTQQGASYNYTLVQHATKLEMTSVSVTPWLPKPQPSLDLEKDK